MHRSYRIFRSWLWELLSVLVAIGLLVAIATLLTSYDGKPAPDWGTRLNLNALLALLSTILRAMMVVIVSQIICQQKWDWYSNKHTRPLSDLQQFDSGSRGSFGALLLIPTVILKDAVTLIAAAVLVFSFLVGPFVQQASRTAPCSFPAPGQNASIPYAHYVPRQGGYTTFPGLNGDPTPETTVAILSSVMNPDGVENQISGSCSTGECTFSDTEQKTMTTKYNRSDSSMHSTVGMCNRCVDIATLVSRVDCGSGSCHGTEARYTLPSGLNVSGQNMGSATFATLQPASDLQWLGDLLTPELRAISRWSYVNATFLTVNTKRDVKAAVCVLYPCLRTYTAFITKNSLIEKEIDSQAMLLESYVGTDMMNYDWANARSDGYIRYTAIRSPCRVGDRVYDSTSNTPHFPGAKNITLYDFTSAPRVTFRNFSVPESCIYRHEGQFVKAISDVLHRDIFDGGCSDYKWISCGKPSMGDARLVSIGVGTVLQKLIQGQASFLNVTLWFDSFANAMTNRLRFQFGAAFLDTTTEDQLQPNPLGEVQGIAWRTETCVSAHKNWLALPICLTTITSLLMLWTMAKSWRHRRTRPVWKDNLLPLLFYRNKIDCDRPETLPWRRDNDTECENRIPLMEAVEMKKISKRTPVTFDWPVRAKLGSEIESTDTSAIALRMQDNAPLPTQRYSQDTDAESVTETIGSSVQDEQRMRRISWVNNSMREE